MQLATSKDQLILTIRYYSVRTHFVWKKISPLLQAFISYSPSYLHYNIISISLKVTPPMSAFSLEGMNIISWSPNNLMETT